MYLVSMFKNLSIQLDTTEMKHSLMYAEKEIKEPQIHYKFLSRQASSFRVFFNTHEILLPMH